MVVLFSLKHILEAVVVAVAAVVFTRTNRKSRQFITPES
jgi:hypothetical protein